MPEKNERGALWDFSTFPSQNIKKIGGGTLWWKKNFPKKTHNIQKSGGVDPLEFFNIHSIATHQKNEVGPLVKKIVREKSPTMPEKNGKGAL